MSRLVVKNLPKTITVEKLKDIFSEKGLVTDVQLKYTSTGKFRHFGFVGFKTEEEAQNAVEYFNNTCINSCRINVEICAALGDPGKPKAWSKYAPDSSAYKKEHEVAKGEIGQEAEEKPKEKKKKKNSIIEEALEKHKDDPLFIEFMETRAKGNKSVWSNDASLNNESKKSDEQPKLISDEEGDSDKAAESETEENVAKKGISDLEYLKMKTVMKDTNVKQDGKPFVELFTVKVKAQHCKFKKKQIKKFFHPLKPRSIRLPPQIRGLAYVGFASEEKMKKALIKHMSFMGRHQIWVLKYDNQKLGLMDMETGRSSKWKDQEESLKNEESVAESGRIFARNLAFTVTEEEIEKLFSKYGPVTEVTMPVDRDTRKIKGYALITFLIPENAARAYMELDGSVLHGRMLHLLPGKPKETLEELAQKEGLTFKQKKILEKKAKAASSHNWNTLFLGQNAVADLLSETYHTTKEKVLDSSGSESIAVRLALGETQIVTGMRDFLEESGVELDAFNQTPKQRSKTVILAKNLPAKTTATEISEMFMKFGEVARVVLPPSGVTAIVEFLEPFEAKAAFTKLAYSKFKNLPLYLEWAPANTFKDPPPYSSSKKQKKMKEQQEEEDEVGVIEEKVKIEEEEEGEEPPEPEATLYIRNLSFQTDKKQIEQHFKQCGAIHEITLAKKKDPKKQGELLSMGYGFIQFKRRKSAEEALKTLQKSFLDGREIELKRSRRNATIDVLSARKETKIGKQTGTKILVRNVPFQATKKEVTELFKAFGELKGLRLPQKMAGIGTGSHRGFAFVDFYTRHDAKRAFNALCQSTHLYGRRLVLEWADTKDSIDDIRKRTTEQYGEGPLNKTLKKSTINQDVFEDSD